MASVQTSSHEGRYLKLTVTQTKGTSEQNYSTINWTLESIGGEVNYYTIYKYGVWIDGVQRYDGSDGLKTKDWNTRAFPAAKGSTSGSFIKYHNNDGSVSDISFSLYGSVFTSAENEYKGTLSMESIPRYAKVSTSTSNLTETSVKINWSSDAAISQVQYRLTVDGSTGSWIDVETGVNKTSGSYTISGLTPGKSYKIDYDYKRKDSELWSFGAGYASSSNIITYNYPSCTVENFTITDNYIYINLYNPLSRNVKIEFYGNDGSLLNWGWRNSSGRLGIGNGAEDRVREYASIPNSKSGSFYAKVIYGNIVNNSPSKTYSIKDDGTEIPTFNASNWSYTSNLTELTNNNQCIINGYSKVIFSIDSAATSDYGASISGYNYKWGNQSNNTGTITGGNGNLLEVAAIDSRGLNKPTSKTLISGENYVPYTTPSLDYSNSYTHRRDGISNETYLTLRGNLSVMKFGTNGVANAIHSAQYKVYDYSNNQWSGPYIIPVNSFTLSSSGYFSLNNYMIHANGSSGGFTTGKRYGIQIILKDGAGLLGTLTTNNILITDGKIARDVYQDSNGNYHQGINGMADENYAEKIYGNENIEGDLYINGNKKLSNTQIDKTLYVGDTGKQLKDIANPQGDTLPIGSIVDYDGSSVPEGYAVYTDYNCMVQKTLFETTTWSSMMTRYSTKTIDFSPYTYVEVEFTGQGGTNATNTILKIDLTQPFQNVITNNGVSYSYGASVCYPDIQLLQGNNNDPGIFRIGACISTAKDRIWMGDPGYFTGQTGSGNFDTNSNYNRISKIVGFKPLQRLRKTQQPAVFPSNNIYDSYNASTTDAYSCHYINTKTSKILYNGELKGGSSITLTKSDVKRFLKVYAIVAGMQLITYEIDTSIATTYQYGAGMGIAYDESANMDYYISEGRYKNTTGEFTHTRTGYLKVNSHTYTSRTSYDGYFITRIETHD